MKKAILSALVLTNLGGGLAYADPVSGDLQLRDAIYLYGFQPRANGSKILAASNCDVFQLVLDVTSQYVDLVMYQGNNTTEVQSSQYIYPDRITAEAAMFAYSLTSGKAIKEFQFGDKNNFSGTGVVGSATAFGYCYSTKTNAFVYLYDYTARTCTYSNGSVISC